MSQKLREFAIELFRIGVLKFGDFEMKVGVNSPVYCDFRLLINYPKMMSTLSELMCEVVKKSNIEFDKLCGVPYMALPVTTLMSVDLDKPMLVRRKEKKPYGTKKMIEGLFKADDKCLVVEDVVVSGASILETARDLHHENLLITDAVLILDREQGCKQILEKHSIRIHSLLNMSTFLTILLEENLIDQNTVNKVKKYLSNTQITYEEIVDAVGEVDLTRKIVNGNTHTSLSEVVL